MHPELSKAGSAKNHASRNLNHVGRRNQVADRKCPARHRVAWEHEPRQEDAQQHHHEAELKGLRLRIRLAGYQHPNRKVYKQVTGCQQSQNQDASVNWDLKGKSHVGSVTGSSRNQFVGVRKPALYRRQTVRLRDSLPRYISHRYWDVRLPRARRRLLITWRWATNGRALCLTSLSCVEASYASFQVVMRPHWDLPRRRGSREAP